VPKIDGREGVLLAAFLCPFYAHFGYGLYKLIKVLEVINMTLNILFFSITIKKRKMSQEEAEHQELVEKLFEQNKDRQISIHHIM
jgi:uncharacterized protein (TIGR02413 family)